MGEGQVGWTLRAYGDLKAGGKRVKQGLRQISQLHFPHLLNGNINASDDIIVRIMRSAI